MYDVPFETQSWTQTLQIFLIRSENGKAKPLRRLLLTLTNILLKHPSSDAKRQSIDHAIRYVTSLICKQGGSGSIKAAIQILEHFLSQDLVNAFAVLHSVTFEPNKQHGRYSQAYKVAPSTDSQKVAGFTGCVLGWVQYPDCAAAAGRLLSAFFKSFECLREQERTSHASLDRLPLWISPTKYHLKRNPHLLEVFDTHILPGLLRLSSGDRRVFLSTLPLDDVQNGNTARHSDSDIQLCLLIARLEMSSATYPVASLSPGRSGEAASRFDTQNKNLQPANPDVLRIFTEGDTIRLGIMLVEHLSPIVRISALSLLISQPKAMQYFTLEVLRAIRRCLPFFHREATAKARNEFIALAKKLSGKLTAAITFLMRVNSTSPHASLLHQVVKPQSDTIPIEQSLREAAECLREHLAFRKWYLCFLFRELQPTSSYQAHITALNILYSFFKEQEFPLSYTSRFDVRVKDSSNGISDPESFLRPLLDLLVDPFDDVRQVAGSLLDLLLSTCPPKGFERHNHRSQETNKETDEVDHSSNLGVVLNALEVAEVKAAETGRAYHADGVGRLYNILFGLSAFSPPNVAWYHEPRHILEHLILKLEEEVDIALRDLPLAVQSASLHGHIIALR